MYFVCTVPFPLLEKPSQATKAIDTVIGFSNVFSTKKIPICPQDRFFFFSYFMHICPQTTFVVEIIQNRFKENKFI